MKTRKQRIKKAFRSLWTHKFTNKVVQDKRKKKPRHKQNYKELDEK